MKRNDDGTLTRDMDNPHGLGPMLTAEERKARLARLTEARDTASAALETLEAIRLRSLNPDGPVPLPEIVYDLGRVR
jgi:hypothetical protein